MADRARAALRGVVATSVTPFDRDGALDEAGLCRVLLHMAAGGIELVVPNGGTGEFASLAPAERRRVVDVAAETLADTAAALMPGVGLDLDTATAGARHARERGAVAVMVHHPVAPYQSPEGWVDYNARVAEAVPELGVVPYVRSPVADAAAVLRLAERCPNVVGLKYGLPDVLALAALADATAGTGLVWVCGIAEAWAPFFWPAGVEGFTSGLANAVPDRSLALLAALRGGDAAAARELWRAFRPVEELRARAGGRWNVAVVKEALAQAGLAERHVRPPMSPLDAAGRDELRRHLARLREPARALA